MSRHPIPTTNGDTFTVGWDAPLGTFYAQRFQEPADAYDDPHEVFWLGATPCELPTIQHLADALGEQDETLPVALLQQLEADRLAEGTRFVGRPAARLIAAVTLETAGPEQADRIREQLRGAL